MTKFLANAVYTPSSFLHSRTSLIRIANYPDRLGLSVKFIENSTRLTCLEISRYWSGTVQRYRF